MKFIADLHIHSHYSRATSKTLNFQNLAKWAQLKGVNVVGSGDLTHPGWLQEMKDVLQPAEDGLFRLNDEYANAVQTDVFTACQAPVRFILSGEISSIYKRGDKVRKVHNVVFMPSLHAVEKFQAALEKIGNIRSDGRPILGLDSRDLLEIVLETDPQAYLIPAHIWTPWFSMLGSKSGFDSVEECFDDLTPHIFAMETGLSSDPPMNWRVSSLDGYTLVSNSDAHSPQKLAREANRFDTDLSYPALFDALKSGNPQQYLGTLEFFPEEGKYHLDGHRKCDVCWHPQTTLAHNGLCAECGKKVTVGVMHRIEELADQPEGRKPERRHPFKSLIPLPEILAEVYGVGPNSKQVQGAYQAMLTALGSELSILLDLPPEDVARVGGPMVAEGIRRMRKGDVTAIGGYDGEYGIIKLFDPEEKQVFSAQMGFLPARTKKKQPKKDAALRDVPLPYRSKFAAAAPKPKPAANDEPPVDLNLQQQAAVQCIDAPLIIVAGPGTGKTRTLTHRIAHLIRDKDVSPQNILAITFTNKAAAEMRHRLTVLLGPEIANRLTISTFHALGAMILRERAEPLGLNSDFAICTETERKTLLKQVEPDLGETEVNQLLEQISAAKNRLLSPEESETPEIYRRYEAALRQNHLLDFDDLILQTVRLFEMCSGALEDYRSRYRWISVDEYQDVNLAQYRLLKLLTGPETNLCVIGDPDQAIYGFRGAERGYFLRFAEDFPDARTMNLRQNYRSTQLILNASSQVIAQSAESRNRELWSGLEDPTRLQIYRAPTDKAEAEYVVHQIEQMVGGTSHFSLDSGRVGDDEVPGRSFGDFAVLYRLNALSLPLVEAFQRSGMPFQTVGQTPFYERKEIRRLLACLQVAQNPNSIFHLNASAGNKPSIRAALDRLSAVAGEQSMPLWNVIQQSAGADFLTKPQQRQLGKWIPFWQALSAAANADEPVSQLIELAAKNLNPEVDVDSERVQQLILRAIPFAGRLRAFLEAAVLQREADSYDPRADRVTLMTLHAAKGLEFPVVFIAGCETGILPYRREGKPFDPEEERRLFYVGMTRAQQKLILTGAKSRFLFGQRTQPNPSPFLGDIESRLKEIKAMVHRKKSESEPEKSDATQLTLW